MEIRRTVEYHSQEWAVMVETGWDTWAVDSKNIATMIYNF